MRQRALIAFLFFALSCKAAAAETSCKAQEVFSIGATQVKKLTTLDGLFFQAGMAIDADGAPQAYHPDSKSGLDALANAGKPGNWWALVVDDKGEPLLQKD